MSVPTVELAAARASASDSGAAPRERPLGALAVAFALALIGWCIYTLARPGARVIDGRAAIAESFDVGALPFDLDVTDASIGPEGDRVIVLANPRAEPEPEPKSTVEKSEGEKSESEKKPDAADPNAAPPPSRPWWKFWGGDDAPPAPDAHVPRKDWSKVPLGPSGRAPVKAYLTLFPREGGGDRVRAGFGGMGGMGVRDLGPMGGVATIDIGKLAWGEYSPAYVHERSYEKGEAGDTFRDSMRVNVSAPGRYGILRVLWPRGARGSKERVEELLAALVPKSAIATDAAAR